MYPANEITLDEIDRLLLCPDILLPQFDDEKFRNSETEFYRIPLASDLAVMLGAHEVSLRNISNIEDEDFPA